MLTASHPRSTAFVAAALLGLAGTASAQLLWTRLSPASSPPARAGHVMAYDAGRDRIVLFGGVGFGGEYTDTWEFDGRTWHRVSSTRAPAGRIGSRMVYDSHRGRIVLFGGQSRTVFADMWEWDGVDWTRRRTATTPPARSFHGMVYDSGRRRIVIFGGVRVQSYGDTWEFDGVDWQGRTTPTAPPARQQFGMAYDAGRQRTVVFGGLRVGGSCLGDTWEWDGSSWREVRVARPPAGHTDFSMCYDRARERVVMFGGVSCGSGRTDRDTWDFDGAGWTLRQLGAGVTAWLTQMVYDEARHRVVLFGGDEGPRPNGETWALAPVHPADSSPYGAGCAGSAGTPALSSNRPWIGDTLVCDLVDLPLAAPGPAVLAFGASDSHLGTIRLPFDLGRFGMPGCFLLTSWDVSTSVMIANGHGQRRDSIPGDPALRGVRLYLQASLPDPSANAAGITMSNGLAITIGAR